MAIPTMIRLLGLAVFALLMGVGWAIAGDNSPPANAAAQGRLRVLFIGNSHLQVKNVPAQVRARISTKYNNVQIRMLAVGGARLSDFVDRPDVVAALQKSKWDVVVLQEASVSFLSGSGRRVFHESVDWFLRRIGSDTRVMLYQTWPWQTGSRYYRSAAIGEKAMWKLMRAEYARAGLNARITIAPVGKCWVQSAHKQSFYSSNGNHASVAGSAFAAKIIARTIVNGKAVGC